MLLCIPFSFNFSECKEGKKDQCANKGVIDGQEKKVIPRQSERNKAKSQKGKNEGHDTGTKKNTPKKKGPKGYVKDVVLLWYLIKLPDNDNYWHQLSRQMQDCKEFSELYKLCMTAAPNLPKLYSCNLANVHLVSDKSPKSLLNWLPPDCPIYNPLPLQSRGDGNCLLNAVSRLVFGDDSHAIELRCRVVVELCLNSQRYWDNNYLRDGSILPDGVDVAKIYASTSGAMMPEDSNEDVFQKEVFMYRQEGQDSSMWQIHALASLLGRGIQSLYYPLDSAKKHPNIQHMCDAFNKMCRPWQRCEWLHSPVIAILWVHDGRGKKPGIHSPNHFVPVVNRDPVFDIVLTSDTVSQPLDTLVNPRPGEEVPPVRTEPVEGVHMENYE